MKELTYRRAHEGKSMATKKEQKIFGVITEIKFKDLWDSLKL